MQILCIFAFLPTARSNRLLNIVGAHLAPVHHVELRQGCLQAHAGSCCCCLSIMCLLCMPGYVASLIDPVLLCRTVWDELLGAVHPDHRCRLLQPVSCNVSVIEQLY